MSPPCNPRTAISLAASTVVKSMMTRREWEWQHDAACVDLELELFFGDAGEPAGMRRRREARGRVVCFACPVQRQCLQFALTNRIRYGLWGGMNEDQRAALLRRGRRAVLTR